MDTSLWASLLVGFFIMVGFVAFHIAFTIKELKKIIEKLDDATNHHENDKD